MMAEKKIAVVSMVRNEADIIADFVEWTMGFADVMYIADHDSEDDTVSILTHLAANHDIILSRVDGTAQIQSEVITSLARKAMSDGAEIIVPLDADEFLMADTGDTAVLPEVIHSDVRAALDRLEPSGAYSLRWVRFVPQTSGGMLLSRPALRERAPEPLSKVVIGANLLADPDVRIAQGNHNIVIDKRPPVRLTTVLVSGLYIAHYPWRSHIQAARKCMLGWLANVAKYTRYTRVANHWRDGFRKMLSGGMVEPEPLRSPVHIAPLIRSRVADTGVSAADIDITGGSLMPVVLRAAEELAEECAEQRAYLTGKTITIIILDNGNISSVRHSLRSAVAAQWPHKQYIVCTAGSGDDIRSIEVEEDVPIGLIARQDGAFKDAVADLTEGDFVQWLPAGYTVDEKRFQHMLPLLISERAVAFSASAASGKMMDDEIQAGYAELPDTGGELYMPGDGSDIANSLLMKGRSLSGGIASFVFRHDTMDRLDWLSGYLSDGSFMELSAQQAVLPSGVLGYINEPLVGLPDRDMSPDAAIFMDIEWYYMISDGALSPDRRRILLEAFCRGKERALGRLAYASSGLREAYEKILQGIKNNSTKHLSLPEI